MPLALLRLQNPLRYTDCFPRKRMMGQSKALLPKPRDSGIAFWDRLLKKQRCSDKRVWIGAMWPEVYCII